jgi:hypothetical protein
MFFIYQHLEDIRDAKMEEKLAPGTTMGISPLGAIEAHRL